MNTCKVPQWSALVTAVLIVTAVAGCSDMLSNNGVGSSDENQITTSDKLQFADLINVRSESDDDDDDDDDDDGNNSGGGISNYTTFSTQLIIGLNDPVLTADRLLKRYGLMKGYRLLKRYDGSSEVIYGIVSEFRNDEDDEIETGDDFELELNEIVDDMEYDEDVQWIEPDILLYAPEVLDHGENTQGQVVPWNIEWVGKEAGDFSKVDLYVLDSGIYANDLHVIEELDFVGDAESTTGKTHGYHIAGTIAAIDNESGVVGVAPGARVHSFRVLNNAGETSASIVIEALDEIISRKNANPAQPMVVNLSFGVDAGTSAYNALDETVEAAVAAGVVVVVSAGNEGINASTITPAHVEEAITVGSFNANEAFSAFSNYGSIVDILAPGEDILSSIGIEGAGSIQLSSRSGTSMAAPHVAGVAVAYLQANPAATPAEVRDALIQSASAVITSVPTGTTNRAVKIHQE